MRSHTELQGNTNTVDKVTAILDGSTHSEFKSFGETIQMTFLGKQNTTLYSIYHHEGGSRSAAGRSRGRKTRKANPIDSRKQTKKPRTGSLNREKRKEIKKCLSQLQTTVQSNVNNQGYNNRYI